MTTPATAPHSGDNPYGIIPALQQGGLIAQCVFGILVIMSAASWYVLFVKLFEQLNRAARVTVVSGPAGSGKSVLLRSWIDEAGLAVPDMRRLAAGAVHLDDGEAAALLQIGKRAESDVEADFMSAISANTINANLFHLTQQSHIAGLESP